MVHHHSDVGHYVTIKKLLDSIFNIRWEKYYHTSDLVEHTRLEELSFLGYKVC
jgi:hypothetical protein